MSVFQILSGCALEVGRRVARFDDGVGRAFRDRIALKDKDHVGIELLTRKLSGKTLAWCNLISRILIIGFVGVVFIWGINLTVESYGTYLPALNISWAWSFLSVP